MTASRRHLLARTAFALALGTALSPFSPFTGLASTARAAFASMM